MIEGKYFTKETPIESGKGFWNYLNVDIYYAGGETDLMVGSYVRNYPNLYKTFQPFSKDGKEYALYSPKYTATRVMELPTCTDVAGEEPNSAGFCPVEYYIPERNNEDTNFGFVSGCYWGDDTSWKVQFLDLSAIEKGVLKRDDRFRHLELPPRVSLKDAITISPEISDQLFIHIATVKRFLTDHKGKI